MVLLKVIDANSSILLFIKLNLKNINPIPNQIHKNKIAVNILSVQYFWVNNIICQPNVQ